MLEAQDYLDCQDCERLIFPGEPVLPTSEGVLCSGCSLETTPDLRVALTLH